MGVVHQLAQIGKLYGIYLNFQVTDDFSLRQGTHRDSFTLFAERVKKYRRKKSSETEEPFNLSLVAARGHRHSLVPQSSAGGITITTPPPQSVVSPSFRMLTAPASYRQNHSLHHGSVRMTFMGGGAGGGGGSPAVTPITHSSSVPSSLAGIAEDGVRVSPPTVGNMICAAPFARVELVRLELPSLGVEFKGRAEFVDEVITSLDEMQEVHVHVHVHTCMHTCTFVNNTYCIAGNFCQGENFCQSHYLLA